MDAVLVIAGSDSSGGAGLARDVATLAAHGLGACIAVTMVTAQTNAGVQAVEPMPPALVHAQIVTALSGGRVRAVKIGALGTAGIVEAVAAALSVIDMPVVLDPVLASTSGRALLDDDGKATMLRHLLPLTTLVTPNLPEAAMLTGTTPATSENEIARRAARLQALGARHVLVKGGHSTGSDAVDLLFPPAGLPKRFPTPRKAHGMRGTGCVLSSAIAAHLARGHALPAACRLAKAYVSRLLDETAGGYALETASYRKTSN
ncbi:MAG: bifunctional hydroxymethylpyrimidine kinase/phosphomethylpyrimidine kinase [Parvibaculaceae bacterium]